MAAVVLVGASNSRQTRQHQLPYSNSMTPATNPVPGGSSCLFALSPSKLTGAGWCSQCCVFIMDTRSCGLGTSLPSIDLVIIHDSEWNQQGDLQAIGRARCLGQAVDDRPPVSGQPEILRLLVQVRPRQLGEGTVLGAGFSGPSLAKIVVPFPHVVQLTSLELREGSLSQLLLPLVLAKWVVC